MAHAERMVDMQIAKTFNNLNNELKEKPVAALMVPINFMIPRPQLYLILLIR